jgi:hypothetical protein
MKKEYLLTIAASLLIMLFLYASISKIIHPKTLMHDMYNQPFPAWLAGIFVIAVPSVEILIAMALIFDRTRMIGFCGSLLLMALFTGYTASILLHFFPRVPCGCGGVIRMLSWPQHLVFNLFFLGVALTGIVILKKRHDLTR